MLQPQQVSTCNTAPYWRHRYGSWNDGGLGRGDVDSVGVDNQSEVKLGTPLLLGLGWGQEGAGVVGWGGVFWWVI